MGETERTDSELLTAYARGDHGAFERLVAGHGGMVYATCLRVLGRRDLAEEAAQAAFLVLAKKAGSVRGNLGAFLHGVARNVARRARDSELARRAREREAGEMLSRRGEERAGAGWEEVRPHLDEAVGRLPAAERAAVVMHYLEGRPRPEVAARLGVPQGTVASRLHRAVGRLRGFLTKRGAGLSAAALAPLLAERAAEATPPAFLVAAAGQIAAAGAAGAGAAGLGGGVSILAKGALKAMFWTKVKLAAAVVGTAAAVGAGVPATVHAVKAGEKAVPVKKKKPVPAAAAKPVAEKALKWSEIGNPLFCSQYRPRGEGNSRFGAWWSEETYRLGWEFYADAVDKLASHPPVIFKSKVVVAVYRGVSGAGVTFKVKRVADAGSEVRVYCALKVADPKAEMFSTRQKLIAIERRGKPVVFFENGKRVAEVLLPRRLVIEKGTLGYHLRPMERGFHVVRSSEELNGRVGRYLSYRGKIMLGAGWRQERIARMGVDFEKQMVLAAFRGKMTANDHVAVTGVVIRGREVRVDLAHWRAGKVGGPGYPYDLIAVPRRHLPVVFYENGKRVAEVLPFRRLVCKKALGSLKARYGVYGSSKEAVAQLPFMDGGKVGADKWLWRGQPPDFAKEMVLAAFKGRVAHTGYRLRISKVSVVGGELRVDSVFKGPPPGAPSGKAVRYPYDLVAVERRNLPVVFYENGKQVARVPFKKAVDKELAGFLKVAKYAVVVGKGTVKSIRGKPGSSVFSVAPCIRLYDGSGAIAGKARPNDVVPSGDQARKLGEGDEIIFARDTGHTYGGRESAIKWSPAREKAVKFALAPGWKWTVNSFRCPWCRGKAAKATGDPKVFAPLGRCTTCKRTVGPATRGVTLRLGTINPYIKGGKKETLRTSVSPGKAPHLWLHVVNKSDRGASELMCFRNKLHSAPYVFLVQGPKAGEPMPVAPTPLLGGKPVHPQPMRGLRGISPFKGSGFTEAIPGTKDAAGKPVFAKPGIYTLRIVAGRLISNPVTVVVEKKAAAKPAEPRAAAARVPRWKAGGNEIAAVDAASGKTLWRAKLRFRIGRLDEGKDKWVAYSELGTGAVYLDAATGKVLKEVRIRPKPRPKPADPPEVF